MKVITRNIFPYMSIYTKLPEIDGVYNKEEIKELISEFEDLLDTLRWAENALSD